MRILRRALCVAALAGGLFAASKQTEADLRKSLTQTQLALAQALRDKTQAQDALKTAAIAQAQLAAALRENARIKAAIEALEVKTRVSQDTAVKLAAKQAAQEAATQAAQQATATAEQLAQRNHVELTRALAKQSANDRQRAEVAQRERDELTAAQESAVQETRKVVTNQEVAAIANEQTLTLATASRMQLDELKRASDRNVSVMYLGTLGALMTFLTMLARIYVDGRNHRWQTAVTVSTVAATTRTAVREELHSVATTPAVCEPTLPATESPAAGFTPI